ncbi:phage virion morphogenesis protein [Pasteurella skyensis]|uniref:Phage virion morphogenesis protein n=1 Tax=Phocoenobacter skyensis TaxID=97481 RepID=A0AAJ6NAD1_9PAST|nr:phage virion morphogenesis protein [Pasteurella skyensis]MDP8173126.1 phage virion morphogenesis protein [Pasteurella skyensis]MDP8178941.1 phage virion morphogenesis protein [Pasteurella skyensis]
MSDLTQANKITERFDALLKSIAPTQRRQLAREIGKKLAQSNRSRIQKQQNPDGTAFAPRKKRIKTKKGKIKRNAMFKKLRTARFMKIVANANGVSVGYKGQTAHIASRHQFGKEGFVDKKKGIKHKYEQRELLGFCDQDLETVEDEILRALSN